MFYHNLPGFQKFSRHILIAANSGIPISFSNSLIKSVLARHDSKLLTMQTDLFQSNLAEIKVTYQSKVKPSDRPQITCSKDAENHFRNIWSDAMEFREECYMLLLNRNNRVLGWYRLSEGGTCSTIIDPRLVFSIALNCNASGVMIAHNHPSGNLKPSDLDMQLTQKLVTAGKFLEIQVIEHIILTADSYFSFADEGKI